MGLGTNHTTVTVADKWIGELWENEAVATYEAKTVMRNLVDVRQHAKSKGDIIHIPNPARGDASAKAANTAVSFIADTANEITVTINKHYEYSKFYEDITTMLALNTMRPEYTADAGYALARRVDAEIHKVMATMQGGSIAGATNLFEKGVIGGDGTTVFSGASNGNGTALTDVGLRRAIQTLEDSDVDISATSLVIPPTAMNTLRGTSRYTEQAFIGDGNAIKTGRIMNLYGVEVYGSSLCPWIHCNSVTGTQSVTFTSAAPTGVSFVDEFGLTVDWSTGTPTDTKYRACALVSKEAIRLYEAQRVRVQEEYQATYLGWAVIADCVFGVGKIRDYGAISLIIPA